jgi:hypothetical protein
MPAHPAPFCALDQKRKERDCQGKQEMPMTKLLRVPSFVAATLLVALASPSADVEGHIDPVAHQA